MSHLASPLIELSGLPDILIQVGSDETMLDNSIHFYEKQKSKCKCKTWDLGRYVSGWHSNAHILKDAEDAIINIGKYCKNLLKN